MDRLLLLDRQVCFALYSAHRAMSQAYAPLLEELGVTYPQYLVLLVLWERDGQAVSELGERLRLDSGTLSPLLQRLEARGLIERRGSAGDERKTIAHLTAKGRRLEARARRIPRAMLECASLRLEDADQLRTRLNYLTRALGRITEATP